MGNIVIYTPDEVAGYIVSIRGKQVILDRDIAALYGVSTKRLNEQVKRNKERFPENFRFQISKEELNELVADCDRFGILKHSSSLPYVFTEQGVAMLSAVLHSDIAVKVSISIMEAFVVMRHDVSSQCSLSKRIDVLELKHLEMRKDLDDIFNRFVKRQIIPVEGVYYDGQIFDAYVFAADLIRSARHSLILIDNYVDDSVARLLEKQQSGHS